MTGSEFQALRTKAGFSQMQLAIKFARHISTVWRWESSELVPPMAEFSLRWLTRADTVEDRAQSQSRRDMEHAARMRELEAETRFAEIERAHPGIFGTKGS